MASEEIPLILNDLLQVPLYQLSKQFRANQKAHEQGANSALKAIKDLAQRVSAKESTGESVDPEKAIAALDKISAKLKEIRAQTKKASQDMQTSLESLTFRLAMRNSPVPQEAHDNKRARSSNEAMYSSERMLELAVISNHLLRTNRFETFKSFCKESDCEFLSQDAETFQTHADILQALIEKHDAEPALAWCAENRSVLKKMNSSLEFELRLRQFLEIVKQGNPKEAVLFARKNLALNAHDERMRRAMGTLVVYPPHALAESPYKSLVEDERWNDLANLFAVERNAALNLNPVSPLEIIVKVGLAATRTNSCRPDGVGRAAGCPACQPSLGTLAMSLPRTLRERSALVCRITGNLMDEPLVLPNGQAYSKAALEQMAQSRGDGKVLCPVTHQEFYLKDAKRAFVL